MQIFLFFAIFISAIFAVPVPMPGGNQAGVGSHIANSNEKHNFLQIERYLDYSIEAHSKSSKLLWLGKALDLTGTVMGDQELRQSLTERWINIAKKFKNNDAKVAKLVARKERKAKEFAIKLAALDVKRELALEGIEIASD
jgi:hypothetical protein